MTVAQWGWLLIALPFLAALAGFAVRHRGAAAAVAIVATGAALAVSVGLVVRVLGDDPARVRESRILLAPAGGYDLTAGTRIDGLAVLVAVVVCAVALLVQLYSVEYLRTDSRYTTYAAEVSLFTAAMLVVVVSGDLLVLLVGWEVMGLCSYLLIGHYRALPGAPEAAVKAFLVTRVGDVGFLLGILVLGDAAGSFRIADVLAAVPDLSTGRLTLATLLLLAGVAGKSAQFPLHVWLPDAMAGPTPISALIHAATMVAAGVYVVARLYPAFAAAPATLATLGVVAAVTMLLGALAALAQDDIKRVLAWSTVSQLAYMTGALAVGGVSAAVFHLLTHAAFKALLFLAAGSVIHAVGTNLMSEMGGLARRMPLTAVTMLVGAAALAGVPPLSGAFSKDAVLDASLVAARGDAPVDVARWVGVLVYVAGLLTVVVTAAYVTRMLVRTFLGGYRGISTPHEPAAWMTGPLLALTIPAALLGAALPVVRDQVPPLVEGTGEVHVALLPLLLTAGLVAVAVVGVAVLFRRAPERDPAERLGRAGALLRQGFRLDDAYDRAVVRPVVRLAHLVSTVDARGVDGLVVGSGRATRGAGGLLARLQTGNVQAYATGVILGALVIAVAVGLA